VGRVRRRSLLAFVVASVALGATGFAATGGVPGHHSPGRATVVPPPAHCDNGHHRHHGRAPKIEAKCDHGDHGQHGSDDVEDSDS
jgi:hypothetical protein